MIRILKTHFVFKRTLKTWENVIKSPVPDINIPKNVLLQEFVLGTFNKWDEKTAVECIETKRRYTFLELREKSLILARFLRNALKLEEKQCAGILLPNLPEYPIAFLASLQAGLQITPINPNYTKEEIKKQLIFSNAKVLFTIAEREKELRSICDQLNVPVIAIKTNHDTTLSSGTINFYEYTTPNQLSSGEISTKKVIPEDVVLLPFSSGTTGLPKGVQLTHRNLVSNLLQTEAEEFMFLEKNQDEIIFAFLPFFHIYGLTLVLLHCLMHGAKLITFPKFTSQSFISGLREYRPTFFPSVPPIVHLINTSPQLKPSEDLASLRLILCGAAPLGESDVERFKDVTGGKVDIIQAYGMTELSPLTTMQTKRLTGGIKIGGSGYLVPNTQAKFVSTHNQETLGVKETGELWIKGPQVMKGYLNNEEATRDMITEDGWLRTGDIGYVDEDGHIFITDRLKELIKVQGFPVAPAELEAVIRNHPLVQDVAVVGVKHERLGEAPKAFVVLKKNAQLSSEELQDFVAKQVTKYKYLVGGVTFLEDIPKTASGKILRKEVKKLV